MGIRDLLSSKKGSSNGESSQTTKATMPINEKGASTLGAVDVDAEVEDTAHQLPPMPNPLPSLHKDFLHCMPKDAPTYRKFSVFTAGSIEQGKAVHWQRQMAATLSKYPITVCNPRRGKWNEAATEEGRRANFQAQVDWELSALEQVDVICFFFDTQTTSPISLLELGLWAASDKVVVCCGDAYYRARNVEITCTRYNVPLVKTFADLVPAVESMLRDKGMRLDRNGDLVGENIHLDKERPRKKTLVEKDKAELQQRVDALEAQLAAQS